MELYNPTAGLLNNRALEYTTPNKASSMNSRKTTFT